MPLNSNKAGMLANAETNHMKRSFLENRIADFSLTRIYNPPYLTCILGFYRQDSPRHEFYFRRLVKGEFRGLRITIAYPIRRLRRLRRFLSMANRPCELEGAFSVRKSAIQLGFLDRQQDLLKTGARAHAHSLQVLPCYQPWWANFLGRSFGQKVADELIRIEAAVTGDTVQ